MQGELRASGRSRGNKVDTNGSAPGLALLDGSQHLVVLDWSPDGRMLAFQQQVNRTGWDLWIVSAAGGVPTRLTRAPFDEQGMQFSPDGRWMVYSSDESGRQEIFAQPFPGSGAKWLVSTRGGVAPRWRLQAWPPSTTLPNTRRRDDPRSRPTVSASSCLAKLNDDKAEVFDRSGKAYTV
jgi:Tol biopolymer transport system component